MVISDFGDRAKSFRRLIEGNPVAPLDAEPVPFEVRGGTDHDSIARGIQLNDIERSRRAEVQSLTLADGEKFNPVVQAENLSGEIDNFPAMLFQPGGGQKFSVIVIRHKTNFHAFLF